MSPAEQRCFGLVDGSSGRHESAAPEEQRRWPNIRICSRSSPGDGKTADGRTVLNPADESGLGVAPRATRTNLNRPSRQRQSDCRFGQTCAMTRADIILKTGTVRGHGGPDRRKVR
jgi:hypothetical protein